MSTQINDPKCETCEYLYIKKAYSVCRRYPPNAQTKEFPKVFLSDWCGEYSSAYEGLIKNIKALNDND